MTNKSFYNKLNETNSEYPQLPLHQIIARQAKVTPDNIALKFENSEITYKDLEQKANSLAHCLIEQGVKPNTFVGLALPRSIELVVSLLAIMKSGAAYLPLDPGFPRQRIDVMLEDSEAEILISSKAFSIASESVSKEIFIEDLFSNISKHDSNPPTINVNIEDRAYLLYTSGSTGKPKGVQVTHKNLVNFLFSMLLKPGINETDKLLTITTISFDIVGLELYLPLIKGATLVIATEEIAKDSRLLLKVLKEENITILQATPTSWQLLLDANWEEALPIKGLCGGEPITLSLAHKVLDKVNELWNMYGPTETTIWSTIKEIKKSDTHITIGYPIANTQVYILNENKELVPPGDIGEICIAGDGVSKGYWKRLDLTSENFITNPFDENNSSKLYKTGDLGRLLETGDIECLGRSDHQVKIRGHRIELGDIETALSNLPFIKRAIVIASDALSNELRLIAYLQVIDANVDVNSCREYLKDVLPEYMIPSIFMQVENFPMTPNGKVDKKNLPLPEYQRPHNAPPLKKPRTKIESDIAKIWSAELKIPVVGIDDNFFEMGGTSILSQKVASLLTTLLKIEIPVIKIYQFPTISGLSDYLNIDKNKLAKTAKKHKVKKSTGGDIAVIGMAGRFPGASSIKELWDVLKNGKETISFFTPEELDKSIPEKLRKDPLYVGARGVVPSAKEFDSRFFGINPKLAEAMDPQQRLFLEIAWEVLEQSGHLPKHYDGNVGVYAGTGTNTYYVNNVLPNTDLVNAIGAFQATTVNDKDYIATRTAYHLNLKGPAVSVHSACSTSLLAIAEAVEAIRSGQCDVALAGASSVTSPINSGHLYQEGSMLSSNGHCRSFDAEGKGTVFSDGAAVVLLKGLEDAINDGDIIHGVIKGIGINNDGGNKGSFTAPSIEGESGAIMSAMHDAKISPSDISYIEAHGTATPLGDPIEFEGLRLAFGPQEKNSYCAVGSIKSNMGHLTSAAGVAGVIKTILALKHKQIPPSLGYKNANPAIDFENSPFFVNNELRDWNSEGKRVAGISSFGVGGTNVHVVVEEYIKKEPVSDISKPLQLLTWSAKTETSLNGYKTALGNFIKSKPEINIADIAASLSGTRDTFNKRSFALVSSSEHAYTELLSEDAVSIKSADLRSVPSHLAFLFPGQGAQYLQMGKALYEHEMVFKEAVDKCSEIVSEALNFDIRQIIYPESNSPEAEVTIKDTQYTQPALFVVEYALSQLWMSWGIQPTLLCGHSIGEFVAAHLAGIFSLKDALLLVAKRGKLVSNLPAGSMLSVRTTYESLSEILPKDLCVAAVNSDQLCVVSGEDKPIEAFAKLLEEKKIPNRLLLTSHAFHSTMMDPVLEEFKSEVEKVTINIPRLPIVSTVTGTWLSDSEATDPNYWTDHLRATVRFSEAMETALELEDIILLEVGPGRALTTLSQQKKRPKSASSIATLVMPKENENSYHTVLSALGQLWLKGIEPNWPAYYEGQSRQKVWLPAYVFDRKLCWVDPPIIDNKTNNYNQSIESNINQPKSTQMDTVLEPQRKNTILEKISEIIINTSGMELEPSEYNSSFLELGLDSLILTQMAITCKNEFNTAITFRQLNDELGTPNLLANFLDNNLPPERFAAAISTTVVSAPIQNTMATAPSAPVPVSTPVQQSNQVNYPINSSAVDLIAQQLQLLGKQLALLQGNNTAPAAASEAIPAPVQVPVQKEAKPIMSTAPTTLSEDEIKEHKKPFGASPKIDKQKIEINTKQQQFLDDLTVAYNKKTEASKFYSEKHRPHMSDPRVVSGFKPLTKELVYPIVIEKSSGNKLWDIDGNQYIDALSGFGSCLLGYQPEFIKEALHDQIELGFEVGPQHPLAGEVCEMLCEMTGHDRAALCNTGSEAVLGAMRIARTVTGKSLIVAFSRSYHGITDEVLVRGSRMKKTFPAAPGIMPEAVQNMLILDYGTEESLQIIRDRIDELAAVLVEPIQSRRPEFQPVEFLKEVSNITKTSNAALIFDEIITGFRMHPQGIQGLFGIKADLATYGKVIGGGVSIGAILGSDKYMDALDGGAWQFGDDSFPEVGVTYFAGTFVRHPLALASTKASLIHLKENGPELQDDLADKAERLATELNTYFKNHNLPIVINYFRSLWRIAFLEEIPYAELVFVILRSKGIHIMEGFPCYMTTAYTEGDVDQIINSIKESIEELIKVGILVSDINTNVNRSQTKSSALNQPPVPGAKLGMDESGNPAWFIVDEKNGNAYKKIEI
ncbi:polyketide synthase [Winogradskyella helgolandensis]|uniref:polyketide synthase n=1 Tax=Winogradskyella helgolandensis TaxID=2697010 RepID=UPI0015CDA527|nr:polyketide synthase [Winogradskyella helgolandensis]